MSDRTESQFVLLHHQFPTDHVRNEHWDLMLEKDGQLMTWALAVQPQPERTIKATRLPNHRIEYLDYEGPISNDRGWVNRVVKGNYRTLTADEGLRLILSFGDQQWNVDIVEHAPSDVLVTISAV